MTNVKDILSRLDDGELSAADELLQLLYAELRKLAAAKLAQERPEHTLQATALVHEAYLRLVEGKQPQAWQGRGHLFSAAATAMERVLVDNARSRKRLKRGGGRRRVELDSVTISVLSPPDELLSISDALERLAKEDSQAAEMVRLRFFAGFSIADAGAALGLSRTIAYEQWTYARAWLKRHLDET